jgi:hypothetical protein
METEEASCWLDVWAGFQLAGIDGFWGSGYIFTKEGGEATTISSNFYPLPQYLQAMY